ncbi:MAG: response regulator [Saprospiraceae bacterium]|nr:response regulator [Saprospiraceae bacterium]
MKEKEPERLLMQVFNLKWLTCMMLTRTINILLAEDDEADCLLFKDALEELPIKANFSVVHDGEQLMAKLSQNINNLPDVLFLDLNMPRKNGFASLGEIKRNSELQHLPVIVFTTASAKDTVKDVFRDAAHYFISKPTDFLQLKKVIYEALTLISQENNPLPGMANFVITGDSMSIPENNESE